jgi:RNA polymerase sigma-70 factor (ECF subfamily)
LDSVSAKSAEGVAVSAARDAVQYLTEISGLSIEEFFETARAESADLLRDELAAALLAIGHKYNFGFEACVTPTASQIGAFWHALHLEDLALAQACALGRDTAWRLFLARFREPLTRAATAITGSADSGRELADSLYSEMYGLSVRDGERLSPLASYSARGSLQGFLRTTLAQRNVDRHRRASREEPLTPGTAPAAPERPQPSGQVLSKLTVAVTQALSTLAAEERFLLASWFLDQRTLLEIARVIGVHEATVSRRIQRLTTRLREDLLAALQGFGMSAAAAEEALGTDPRDVDVNLRSVLQASRPGAFQDREPQAGKVKEPEAGKRL